MSVLKTISRNIFSNYVGIGGSIVIAFLLSPFLIHTLGDTNYGVWSVIAALTGYMALLDLGVSSAVAKYVAKYKALDDYPSLNKVMNTGLLILISVGILLICVSPMIASGMVRFFGFENELGETVSKLILIASFDIAIFVTTNVLAGAYFGFQRYEVINAVNLSVGIMKALAFYWALSNGYGLLAMGVISLISNIMITSALFLVLKKIEPKVRLNPARASRSTAISIVDYSKYTFLSMLAMQLVYYSDAFVIGYFLSAAAITIYTIPWSLTEYTNKLMLAITQTFVPVFSQQDATESNQEIYSTYITGTKFMLVLSNLLCLGILANGDYFIALWMGEKYAVQCSALLMVLFTTQLIKGPQLLSYSILLGTANHKRYSFYNFGFSLLNLMLSIMLVQKYGLIGVAVATAITQITMYGIVTPILTSRAINSSLTDYFKQTYLRVLPASVLLFVLLKYFATVRTPDSYIILLSQAAAATMVYLVAVYFTLLDSSERKIINSGGRRALARVF